MSDNAVVTARPRPRAPFNGVFAGPPTGIPHASSAAESRPL